MRKNVEEYKDWIKRIIRQYINGLDKTNINIKINVSNYNYEKL